jgi:hypothetical protein
MPWPCWARGTPSCMISREGSSALMSNTPPSHRTDFVLLSVCLFFGATTYSILPSEVSSSLSRSLREQATERTRQGPTSRPQAATFVVYKNKQYGFSFYLPKSWKGYSILVEHEEGGVYEDNGTGQGQPTKMEQFQRITIRHPLWTEANPRQDIPIMIFTYSQWLLIEQERLIVSAAPFGPGELGRNAKYVFAVPARYDYAFPTGWEEVVSIFQRKPLHPF